ncbi:MAG: hypothetical protein GY828_00165, partial [Candidatus Gracilibacteria bacterium]|nr:hypothetical protein [Candidatus Gracilibacteria bacterium]
ESLKKVELFKILDTNSQYYETIIKSSLDNNKYKLLIINGLIRSVNKQNDAWKYFDLASKELKKQNIPYMSGISDMLTASYSENENMHEFSNLYIKKAHENFSRWKADELTCFIEKNNSSLFTTTNTSDKFNLVNIDFEAVVRASHVISEEISLEELLDKTMKIIVENSGSQCGFLLLQHDNKLLVEAAYDFTKKSCTRDI